MIRSLLIAAVLVATMPVVARAETLGELQRRFRAERSQPYAVRIKTVQAIAALGTVEAALFLLDVVEQDEESSIRLNTIHQVARMPPRVVFDRLLRIVTFGDTTLRSTAFHAIVYNRKEALPETLLANMLVSTESGFRSNAVRYLARRKDGRLLAEAEKFLRDFPTSASSLTSILIEAKTPGATRLLLRIYDDTRRYDREQGTKLFQEGDASVRAVLVETLGGGDRRLVLIAATLVARARISEAEAALVAALPTGDPELHAVLVEAIGAVGGKTEAGRSAILAALTVAESEILAAGARAARDAPSREAVPLLIRLLGATSRLVKAEAAVTLERVTGQQYGDAHELWERWWGEYGTAFDPAAVEPRKGEGLSQALVDLAIERGAAALKGARRAKPPWSYSNHDAGTTALVLLALHASGCTKKDRDVKAALDYLRKCPVPEKTYETGLMAMALEALGGKKYRRRISECAKRLRDTQLTAGLWGYPTGDGDNSNTQYAVLGLRAASRVGVKVPQRVWAKVRDHFLAVRGKDGGWAYPIRNPDYSSSSMTAAGVCCLLVCLEHMKLDEDEERVLREAIDQGYAALGQLMKLDKDSLYALYGIERAGVLGGRKVMAGKPWYVPGARRLLDEQGRDGFWTGTYDQSVDTAFAILFLKRATVPIAAAVTR